MLEHDEITLALLVPHQSFQLCTEGIQQVLSSRSDFLGQEQPDPSEARYNASALAFVGELAHRLDAGYERAEWVVNNELLKVCRYSPLRRVISTDGLLGDLSPREIRCQPLLLGGVEEAQVNQSLDEFGESLVAQSAANDGLGLRNVVKLAEGDRVAVGVGHKGERGGDEVCLGVFHEVASNNIELLAF